uniref:Ubiquitin-like-conjugating enzyme ATG10 n=1 Tax=Rhizophora mucronata TaxID=61149 RepID=A0A2P2JKW4_RHIMU
MGPCRRLISVWRPVLLQINGKGSTQLPLLGYGFPLQKDPSFARQWTGTCLWTACVFLGQLRFAKYNAKLRIFCNSLQHCRTNCSWNNKYGWTYMFFLFPFSQDSVNDASLSEDEKQEEEVVDNATLVQSSRYHEEHFYDFHIVYCPSYRVPVLYFRGYCSDGRPLALNEIEKDLPSCSAKALLESKWTFITQEEHPYLNRPWYKLHPCGTGKWMKLLFLDAALAGKGLDIELYLVSWCSVVGQVVGLRIPLEMLNVI